MNDWKELISCAFIIHGEFSIDVRTKINNEIEEVIKKHMLENNISTCDRTFMGNQVVTMIEEFEKYLENIE